LLTGPSVAFAGGLDLLDGSNRFVEDISDDLVTGTISWDNRDAVNGSCRLSIQRTLAWGRDRVRPFMVVSDGAVEARFNLGVFVLTAPEENRGQDVQTFDVTGYDLLTLLQTGPGDTYVALAGTTYFDALQAIVTASGVGARLLIDGTRQATAIPETRVWALTNSIPSWLRMMYDLLTEIGYTPPWVDVDGNIRARPYQDISVRASEWPLDTTDPATNIVGEERKVTVEAGDVANSYRFIRTNMDTTPVEGDGIYTPPQDDASIATLGRVIPKVVWLDAADQAALVAQGDKVMAEDRASVRTINLSIDPLPIMGMDDVFTFTDAGQTEKIQAASWDLNLDGSPGALQLGGAPAEPLPKIETQVKATVTSAAELRVVVDGATVDSFANALDAAAYSVGDRVTVTVRNPLPPLVQGVET
jgi:hypothetical protein